MPIFEDPDDLLEVPVFGTGSPRDRGAAPSSGPADVASASLTKAEVCAIKQAWHDQQARRQQFHAESLTVYVDGHISAQCTPQEAFDRAFTVPSYASCVQVYGHDAEGELLLAVSEVPDALRSKMRGTVTCRLVLTDIGGELNIVYGQPLKGVLGKVWQHIGAWWRQTPRLNWACLQPIPTTLQPWAERRVYALVEALAPEELRLLHARYQTFCHPPPLRRLRLDIGRAFAPRAQGMGHAGTSTVLIMFQKDVVPFLRTCQPSDPPTSDILALTAAQRDQLVARLSKRARRLRLPLTEEQRLLEAFRFCLLGENRIEGGMRNGLN